MTEGTTLQKQKQGLLRNKVKRPAAKRSALVNCIVTFEVLQRMELLREDECE